MRQIAPDFAATLTGTVTTLCHCWRLTRRDGLVQGFTDHDRDISLFGVTFAAASGFDASDTETALGLSTGGGEVSGALSSDVLSEDDLANGAWDGASVEVWLVNWDAPDQRVLLDIATIGEVRRSEFAYTAELRSAASFLDQESGLLFQRLCSADLGDARCKVALTAPAFACSGSILAGATPVGFSATLERDYPSGFFTGGKLTFTSGGNSGVSRQIKDHAIGGSNVSFLLWTPLAHPVATGDGFAVTAGCDKTLTTCRCKFNNLANHRGFPHMPGNDIIIGYPNSNDPIFDGGSLFSS
ncbi:MAG: hypothetical protein QOG66_1702 [Methylobacteriaceae bacterium]|jgi:uncharacterized phage protein (TIGR02218 family)|nr:hypothetical protein [Methylobacteriaceae bacterium]